MQVVNGTFSPSPLIQHHIHKVGRWTNAYFTATVFQAQELNSSQLPHTLCGLSTCWSICQESFNLHQVLS